jgi:tRNA threonylcarbamoyl adenosine modification protein YjeE
MALTTGGDASFSVALPDEQATRRLAVDVANILQPGDVVTLSGDLGAGKTSFARALIRYLAGTEDIEVPSPSFTLMQTYDLPQFPVLHADLYRISDSAELGELGFEDIAERTVVLLEWPDRAGSLLPADRLDFALTLAPRLKQEFRHARLTGFGTFAPRLERMAAARRFLAESGYSEAQRQRLQGDASTRSYERLTLGGKHAILMNSPPRPDGPPVRDGRSYGSIVHLAENVVPFVALAKALLELGLSAPQIYHADLEQGLLLLEDLGDQSIVAGDPPAPIKERYETAVDALLLLHQRALPDLLPVAPHLQYRIPVYDLEAFLVEVELLLDWYLPRFNVTIADDARETFRLRWREALQSALEAEPTWVLRDFHSPNLLWLPERQDTARVGLLDFQDTVMGPRAYDLASLLQDARVDVPEALEVELLGRYMRGRRAIDADFDATAFINLYVTLAAQRTSRILGTFARLDRRDGKPQYLRHMPRVWSYLQRSLAHPTLALLAEWYAQFVPALNTIVVEER